MRQFCNQRSTMGTVSVNPPKTPVTEGSNGVAAATLPNICKMPGPPAPFVPTPLPNIGKSAMSPKDYSTTVKFDGKAVAIQGSSFGSMGDIASKGTGGGLISMNCEGPTKFIGPGSLDVKVDGKAVQLLGDQMLNNCGPSGSPANAATMFGLLQEAKAKNPGNDDVCGAGKHSEKTEKPEVPDAEKTPAGRLAAMAKTALTDGDKFEVKAAAHNIADGSITSGDQISRNPTPEEKAAGNGDAQKIWAVCTVCGHRREVDQATDKGNVEAKSTPKAVRAGAQKANNRALVANGTPVTYKTPPVNAAKAAGLTAQGLGHIPIP